MRHDRPRSAIVWIGIPIQILFDSSRNASSECDRFGLPTIQSMDSNCVRPLRCLFQVLWTSPAILPKYIEGIMTEDQRTIYKAHGGSGSMRRSNISRVHSDDLHRSGCPVSEAFRRKRSRRRETNDTYRR